jgi:hypothetical protein
VLLGQNLKIGVITGEIMRTNTRLSQSDRPLRLVHAHQAHDNQAHDKLERLKASV